MKYWNLAHIGHWTTLRGNMASPYKEEECILYVLVSGNGKRNGMKGPEILALLSLIIVRAQFDCISPSSDPPLDSDSAVTSQQPATLRRITSSLLGTDRHHAEQLYTANSNNTPLLISNLSFIQISLYLVKAKSTHWTLATLLHWELTISSNPSHFPVNFWRLSILIQTRFSSVDRIFTNEVWWLLNTTFW